MTNNLVHNVPFATGNCDVAIAAAFHNIPLPTLAPSGALRQPQRLGKSRTRFPSAKNTQHTKTSGHSGCTRRVVPGFPP